VVRRRGLQHGICIAASTWLNLVLGAGWLGCRWLRKSWSGLNWWPSLPYVAIAVGLMTLVAICQILLTVLGLVAGWHLFEVQGHAFSLWPSRALRFWIMRLALARLATILVTCLRRRTGRRRKVK